VRHASAGVALSLRQGYCYGHLLAAAPGFTPETSFVHGFYSRFGVSPVAAQRRPGYIHGATEPSTVVNTYPNKNQGYQ
jgi:hypothetical protein